MGIGFVLACSFRGERELCSTAAYALETPQLDTAGPKDAWLLLMLYMGFASLGVFYRVFLGGLSTHVIIAHAVCVMPPRAPLSSSRSSGKCVLT